MPWTILETPADKPDQIEREGKFRIVSDLDGKTVGKHDTREQAESQFQSLYDEAKSAAPVPQRKGLEMKADLTDNYIKGPANVMGTPDEGADVMFPGCFSNGGVLRDFLRKGFVSDTHEWTWEGMKAMPVVAREDGRDLYTEAVFHSTQDAQDARIKARERIERNLAVGLSIGFLSDWEDGVHWFEDGEKLLQFAEDNGYNLALFDEPALKRYKRPLRGITKLQAMFEYAITPVPMNQLSLASDAKSIARHMTEREFDEFLIRAGFARKAARIITLHGFKALANDQPDADASAAHLPEAGGDAAADTTLQTPSTPEETQDLPDEPPDAEAEPTPEETPDTSLTDKSGVLPPGPGTASGILVTADVLSSPPPPDEIIFSGSGRRFRECLR
jgi:hypothetical protein